MSKRRKPFKVYCPLCGNAVGKYEVYMDSDETYACQVCHTLVVYIVKDEKSKVKQVGDRNDRIASSGRRFL